MRTIEEYCRALDKSVPIRQSLDVIMGADLVEGYGAKTLQVIRDKIGKLPHAITVTFTDDQLYRNTERYLCDEVNKVFKSVRHVQQYILISDISCTGRFHLHGAMSIYNIHAITTLRRKLSRFGITKVKLIDNTVKWSNYCVEQYTEQGKKNIKIPIKAIKIIEKGL